MLNCSSLLSGATCNLRNIARKSGINNHIGEKQVKNNIAVKIIKLKMKANKSGSKADHYAFSFSFGI